MAKEAGLPRWYQTDEVVNIDLLGRFAELVAAAEREECAKVCENHPDGLNMMGGAFVACAAAIRARGNHD